MQYMKRKDVDEKLNLLVNVIRAPRGLLTIEQLSKRNRPCKSVYQLNIVALVSPMPQIASVKKIRGRKLCPLPVQSFMGRKDILDKMRRYFDLDSGCQCVFVLHGLGGSGKTQIALKFLQESKTINRYASMIEIMACEDLNLKFKLLRCLLH